MASGEVVDWGAERRDTVDAAHRVEQEIVKGCKLARSALTYLAPRLLRFYEERMWEALGYDSMNQFLASPEIELSPSYVKAISYTYRDLVVHRGVPAQELEGVDLRKLQYALPAVKSGDVKWQEAVSDARALSRPDMQDRYSGRRKPNAPLDADAEPERQTCPTCGSWVETERLEG